MDRDYRKEIQQIEDLPTIPETFRRINRLLTQDEVSIKQLSDEILMDQSLTVNILKIVNSAFFGLYRQITDLNDAIALLGFNDTKLIIMGVSIFDSFSTSFRDPWERFRFWEHSMLCSVTADTIEELVKQPLQGLSVASLLHDIGKVVLDQYYHDDWVKVMDEVKKGERPALEIEQEIMGTTHPEIGFYLAESWNLPPSLAECVRHHHAPDPKSAYYEQTCAVALANVLAKIPATATQPFDNTKIPQSVLDVFGFSKVELAQILDLIKPHIKGVKAMLGAHVEPPETEEAKIRL